MSPGSSPVRNVNTENLEARTPGKRPIKTALIAVGLLLLLLFIIGLLPRLRRHSELALAATEKEQSVPRVDVIKPHHVAASNELVLPATTQAIQEAVIYARTSGYVRRWLVGLGKHVRAGQLLAEIDVPESNQQLQEAQQQLAQSDQTVTEARAQLTQTQAGVEQAEATLRQTRTNLELARVNLERSKTLTAQGVLAQQDTDDKQAVFDARQADVDVALANVRSRQAASKAQEATISARQSSSKAQQASVRRFADVKSFQQVTAPFEGEVTARNLEVGMLVNATGGLVNNAGLYRISRLDIIRVFVNVPQSYAPEIHPGLPIQIEVTELPQHTFSGKVFTTSNSIDPVSRTLTVEVEIPNPTRQLLPGMYAQVKIAVPTSKATLAIPAGALLVNANGTQVIIVRADQTAHYQKIEIGRDLGKEIELISGLSENDVLVAAPADSIREGMLLKINK